MYANGNPRTKKDLKEKIAAGGLTLFAPGLGSPVKNGVETIKGPHSPEPHRWYAQVLVKDGIVVKLIA